jgi:hypothetical protein
MAVVSAECFAVIVTVYWFSAERQVRVCNAAETIFVIRAPVDNLYTVPPKRPPVTDLVFHIPSRPNWAPYGSYLVIHMRWLVYPHDCQQLSRT